MLAIGGIGRKPGWLICNGQRGEGQFRAGRQQESDSIGALVLVGTGEGKIGGF